MLVLVDAEEHTRSDKADTLTATYKSDSFQLMLDLVDAEEHTRSDIQS